MKKMGTVKNMIHDGTMLLAMDPGAEAGLPPLGATAYDQRGAEVGRVARVFGPVQAPYVSVRPRPNADSLRLIGTSLYLDPEQKLAQRAHKPAKRAFEKRKWKPGPPQKKGVKGYRRKEKPRKR